MLVGVLSDSHWHWGDPLPGVVDMLKSLKVEAIIHCGDVGDLKLLEELEKIAPVHLVAGNCDSGYLREKFGIRKTINLDGINVGMVHGNGYDNGNPEIICQNFTAAEAAVITFGHTHQPFNQTIDGKLLFNPGSCSKPRGEAIKPSFGLLHLDGSKEKPTIDGKIIFLR